MMSLNEQAVQRRNYRALLAEGSFFITGMAFMNASSVIPVFIHTYTRSVLLAGLATTITHAASIILQVVVGPYVRSIRNVPAYITRVMFLFRPLPFIMIPLLYIHPDPWLTVAVFLLIYTLLFAGDGLILVPWTDLFSRTVSSGKRGSLLGTQQLIGGVGALLAGLIVKAVLDSPHLVNDQRYAIIFGASALFLTLSAATMPFTRDLPRTTEATRPGHRQYYKALPLYLRRHAGFRQVVLIRILSFVMAMIAPFVILFGQNKLALSPGAVSTLIYIQLVGGLSGGVIWGRVSRILGNHRVILLTQGLGLLLAFSMMVITLPFQQLLPVYLIWPLVFINGVNLSAWIGFMNHTIDIVSDEERTIYLLISNLTVFPFSFLPFLAGLFVHHFGYLPVFIVSTLAGVVSLLLALRLKPASVLMEKKTTT